MAGLFGELRRRNVLRMAAAYGVVAWLVIEVADTIFPVWGVPGWVMMALTVLAIAGFPICIVISWIYEWTPTGLITTEAADEAGYAKPAAFGRQIDFVIIALLVVAVGWLIYDKQVGPAAPDKSIAVLPFVNMSSDPEQEYFSDGISEELLNLLAGIPELRVAARTSSFRFRGKDMDIADVARQLGVAHILEGSVRKSGSRLRITAQLISAGDGFHIWSETYDRELDDIFAVQDEIAGAIVAALRPRLNLSVAEAPRVFEAANRGAYEEYLMGRHEMAKRGAAPVKAAMGHFEAALRLDPDYAPAQARLAMTYMLLSGYVGEDFALDEMASKARPLFERALALAPDLAEAQAAKGFYFLQTENPSAAEPFLRRAVALNPSYSTVYSWLASALSELGRPGEAFEARETAVRVDPLAKIGVYNLALTYLQTGRFDEAQMLIDRMESLRPAFYQMLLASEAGLGGRWADETMAYLEVLAIEHWRGFFYYLQRTVATKLNLPEDTVGYGVYGFEALIQLGRPDEAIERMAEFYRSRATPTMRGKLAEFLALAGRKDEALGHFEAVWAEPNRRYFGRFIDLRDWPLLPMFILLRRAAGDQAGAIELMAYALDDVASARREGYATPYLDMYEGVLFYLSGDRQAGLRLIDGAIARGAPLSAPYQRFFGLDVDPDFAPIRRRFEEKQRVERDKFLGIVCNGGNPAPEVWQPLPETCAGHVAATP